MTRCKAALPRCTLGRILTSGRAMPAAKFAEFLRGTVMKLFGCVLFCLLLAAMPLPAQAPGLSEIYSQIRAEETSNSKIMWLIHQIADV